MPKVNRRPNCKCALCEKEVYRAPNLLAKGNVFCSLECVGLFNRKNPSLQPNEDSKKLRPNPLKVALAHERGGVCELCQYNNFAILQAHHIIEKSNGGSDDLENLMLLCPTCHALQHFDPNSPSAFQIATDLGVIND